LIQRLLRWRRSALSLLAELSTTTRALRETEERYRLALAGANDGIWDWDLRTNRVFYSHRWKWLLGYAEHEIGESPAEWYSRIHSDDRKRFQEAIAQHLEGKAPLLDVEIRMVTREGQWRWMQVRGVAILDEHQRPVRLAGSISDVTRRKVAEEELRHGALHDPLTQLATRAYFLAFLERAVASVLRHPEQQFAILFIDLDGFKSVNDQFGHAVGDEVLACIARASRTPCARRTLWPVMVVMNSWSSSRMSMSRATSTTLRIESKVSFASRSPWRVPTSQWEQASALP
jgi:PAS domain S-box-containing protein